MPRHHPSLESSPQVSLTEVLLDIINDANRVFAGRHDWLSPMTSDEERKQFISRCCEWWNCFVCPAMDRVGVVWDEAHQCFEINSSQHHG